MDSDGYLSQLADIFQRYYRKHSFYLCYYCHSAGRCVPACFRFCFGFRNSFFSRYLLLIGMILMSAIILPTIKNKCCSSWGTPNVSYSSDIDYEQFCEDIDHYHALQFLLFMNVFVFPFSVGRVLILTVILTFLLLLFGEIMPKIYSAQKTLAFAVFFRHRIYFLEKVFRPIATVLVRSTTF